MYGNKYTLAQLAADLDTRMNDAADTHWTQAQKNLAIQTALRNAEGQWWDERIDDTNTYSTDGFRYTLPPICQGVEAVYFEPMSSDEARGFVVPSSYHIEGDTLVFSKKSYNYDGQKMYIVYLAYPTNLLTLSGTNGAIATTTTKALTSSAETFLTKGTRVGDAVIINESGYAGNGTYYVASVDSETQLTLHKAPGTVGTSLDFTVAQYTDMPYEYIINAAMAEMYEMALRDRPGVEVTKYVQFATYYRELAQQALRKHARPPNPYRRY